MSDIYTTIRDSSRIINYEVVPKIIFIFGSHHNMRHCVQGSSIRKAENH